MESSKPGYQVWAAVLYLLTTSIKGVLSMNLHCDPEVTRKTAWHLSRRLRMALENEGVKLPFPGPVEADKTCVGDEEGKRA